jgi:CBS domain-containing protein
MVRTPQTANPEDSITEVAGRMASSKMSCFPVLQRGDLVGMITTTDILMSQVQTAMVPPKVESGPKVADVMTPRPETVHPDDYILDAAGRMRNLTIRHLPVVDGQGALVGILSDRDIRSAVGDPTKALDSAGVRADVDALRVQDAMTPEVVTVHPSESCASVARLFVHLSASAVPVLDEGGGLVGILSYVDLLRGLSES